MLITFKNTNAGKQIKTITDPFQFLTSGGKIGYEIEETNPNYEFITIEVPEITTSYKANYDNHIKPHFQALNNAIDAFLKAHPDFLEHKENYYTEFSIPKKKPGADGKPRWRHLINPCFELKQLQKQIAAILQHAAHILPHNAAHAFREGRDYYTNAAYHQSSKHIINLDLKDFFDSITEDILFKNLRMHPAFNVDELGLTLLQNIIKIATYKGTTPQGSPLSPYLSNIIMVNFDFRLRKLLNQNEIATFYTRYADDMTFSSKKSQDITHIIHLVESVLKDHYSNKIKINYEKTKKITPGRCFITGVKLNQKHDLTVGWEKKKEIKSRIYNLNKRILENTVTPDDLTEAESIIGYLAFMNNVEPGYTNYIRRKYMTALAGITAFINLNPFNALASLD